MIPHRTKGSPADLPPVCPRGPFPRRLPSAIDRYPFEWCSPARRGQLFIGEIIPSVSSQILNSTNMFLFLWRTNKRMLTWSSRRVLFNAPLSQVRTKMRSSCFWRHAATISASKLRRRTKRPTERWAQTLGTKSRRQPAVKLTDARRPCQPFIHLLLRLSYRMGLALEYIFITVPAEDQKQHWAGLKLILHKDVVLDEFLIMSTATNTHKKIVAKFLIIFKIHVCFILWCLPPGIE